jgi:filamentous hemagglutinin family protein
LNSISGRRAIFLTHFHPIAALAGAVMAVGILLQPAGSHAQTNITASGLGTQVTQAGTTFNITGGTASNGNLFHSFGLLSVGAGDIANFNNVEGRSITNILGRVTGGQVSSIFGTIQTSNFGAANLFLINPAGWIFGPTASLDVGGAFHVSTADYIRLGDGLKFDAATGPAEALLMSAPPAAFGFQSANPARIAVNGSSLQVATGNTLSLVAGEAPFPGEVETGLKISGVAPGSLTPTLRAPGGRIQIVSVASPGEVTLNPDVSAFETLGRIDLTNGARIDASGVAGPGGAVVIRGGQLFASQSTRILANTTGNADGAPTAVDVQVRGDMVFAGGSSIEARTSSGGAAGDVRIAAGSLELSGFASVSSVTSNGGTGADILIDVGMLTLHSGGGISSTSDLVGATSGGPGGDVIITATGPVSLDGVSGGLSVVTRSVLPDNSGTGGRLSISAPSLTLDNRARVTSSSSGTGASGDVVLEVGSLAVMNGATIRGRTTGAPGGRVMVTATDSAEISGSGSGIFSGSSGSGSIGEITVDAGRLTLMGGVIQSGSSLDPGGGNVTVTGRDSIVITEGGGISSQAQLQDVGAVAITTPSLLIDNGFVSTSTIGVGRAGDISVNAQTLALANGGQIASSSDFGASGDGGTITVNARDSISISGTIPPGFEFSPSDPRQFSGDPRSGIFSTSTSFENGSGGNISVQAGQLVALAGGGTISATSFGTGNAGSITITAGNQITLNNGSITTQALTADGGNITLMAPNVVQLQDSVISTSVQGGLGQGGNILIDPQFVILNNSSIIANAFGGPGGNITIIADNFLSSATSVVEASSALSTPGVIQIVSPDNNIESSIAPLSAAFIDASSLLGGLCSARRTGAPSSFVVAGRGGVPVEADGYRPSFGTDVTAGLASTDGPVRAEAGPRLDGSALMFALMMNDPYCLR